jgi:hypothetical protein
MKTNLPDAINSIEEAKLYLSELLKNHEAYHPEDDAHEIVWGHGGVFPTKEECDKLNKLMGDIYNLEGNKDKYPDLAFDPCEYLHQQDVRSVFAPTMIIHTPEGRICAMYYYDNSILYRFDGQEDVLQDDICSDEKGYFFTDSDKKYYLPKK